MNARQFFDLVVELRKAQKQAATTLKFEEIERVTKILKERNDYGSKD